MSLLFLESKEEEMNLAQKVYERQFNMDSQLQGEFDERRRKLMLQDILYNLVLLNTAVKYDAEMLIYDYAEWIYKLLAYRMTDLPEKRIKEQMVMHYNILKEVLTERLAEEEARKAVHYLDGAVQVTENVYLREPKAEKSEQVEQGKLTVLQEQYLELLLNGDKYSATNIIKEEVEAGTPLQDIYIYVLQEAMYKVGRLWHEGKITVDREHYCTAVTQSVMAQLYPIIFATPRKGFSMLACCVGSELHEMGIRMLCDLFELNGWDTIYLGAAVPAESIIHAIEENKPHLVALSATMPHHLNICHEIVRAIKEDGRFSQTRVALGGRAFHQAPHLYEKWGADIFVEKGTDLVDWANENF